jgi:hypothetical protein
MTSRNDELVAALASVRDEELATPGEGTQTLLAEILLDRTGPEQTTDDRAAPDRPRSTRRRILGLGVIATAAAFALVIGIALALPRPTGSYANAAIEIDRHGNTYTVRIKDAYADPGRFAEVFHRAGLEVNLRVVPVSPSLQRTIVSEGFSGQPGHTGIGAGPNCPPAHQGTCPMTMQIYLDPAAVRGHWAAEAWLGRPAHPDEDYAQSASATRPGEALAGLPINGRTVGDVLTAIRSRHLGVTYKIRFTRPDAIYDQLATAAEIGRDRRVVRAEMQRTGVVRLIVAARPGDHNDGW